MPNSGTARPFGLTLTQIVPAAANPDGTIYDPQRQVNTGTDGQPATGLPTMGTTYNTQYDHQWFTDKD